MATNLLRWIIAVPAGLAAWYAATFSIGMAFSVIHGEELVDSLWAAPDMNGMPIIGTYIIFVTRMVAAASLVGMILPIVPGYQKQVAIVVVSFVSAFVSANTAVLDNNVANNTGLSFIVSRVLNRCCFINKISPYRKRGNHTLIMNLYLISTHFLLYQCRFLSDCLYYFCLIMLLCQLIFHYSLQ